MPEPAFVGYNPFPVAPAGESTPDAVALALYAHVRAILTGDPNSATPAASVIDYYAADATPEMLAGNPCLARITTDADKRFYSKALALEIVLQILQGPGANEYEAQVIRVSTDNVDRTIQNSRTLADALMFLRTEKARMLSRVSCIAASRSAAPFLLMDVVGARRAQQERCDPYGLYGGFLPGGFWYRLGFTE